MKLRGKTVLITGASSGIGEALAKLYASKGANLILVARRKDRLKALADSLAEWGGTYVVAQADVSVEGAMETALSEALKALPRIDTVIAGSAFGVAGRIEDLSIADFQRQFETNVYGVLRTFYATFESLKASRGRFAVIGSVNGFLALPGNGAYAMSKHAVKAMTDSLRLELRPYGIRVTHISPGFVATEIRQVSNQGEFRPQWKDPIPRWACASSEHAAKVIERAVRWGCREKSITAHGWMAIRLVRFFPGFTFWLMRQLGVSARPAAK
jgi:NAD(P)-dependent dehydrogenase (short-subunit alcohol dehydrogenase family)